MPDNRLGIGVDISATGADTFKKQVDDSVKSLEGMKRAFVQVPKVNLGDRLSGVPELKRNAEDTVDALDRLKGAFVQMPTSDASGIVSDFRRIPPVISQSVASLDSYKRAVGELKNTPGIKVPVSLVSLDQLQAKLESIRNKLQTATDPKLFTKLRDEATKTQAAISALGKTVDASGKQIANVKPGAAQASSALTNLGRVAQDAPFGFIGIQNNIGPLIDSFGYLSTATKQAGGPLRALGSALVGPAGIGLAVAAVTGLVTVAIQKYGSLGNALDVVFGLTSNVAQANRDLAKSFAESEGSAAGEVANVQALVAIANNKALADGTRQQALNKLNKEYDAYLPKLTLETIGTEKAKTAIDALTSSLVRQAKIKGVQDLISKAAAERASLLVGDIGEQASILDQTLSAIKTLGTTSPLSFSQQNQLAGAERAAGTYDKLSEKINAYEKALQTLTQTEAENKTLDPTFKEKPIQRVTDLLGKQIAQLERVRKAQQDIADIPTIDKKIAAFDVQGLTPEQIEEITGKRKLEQAFKDIDALIKTSERLYQLKNLKISADFKKGVIDQATADDLRQQLRNDLDKVFLQQALLFEGTVRVKPTVAVERADLTQPEIESEIAKKLGLDKALPLNATANVALNIKGIDTRNALAALEQLGIEFNSRITQILNEGITTAATAIGEGIGNAFSGEGIGNLISPFLNAIAGAITELGKATIAYGVAMTAIKNVLKKAFNNPYVAIAAGIAAVAVGQVLRNKAQKVQGSFEGGGVISGPNSGYPVMLHGTEAIVPLDNNRYPFGVSGASQQSGIGNIVGVIRGKDINLINRRAETSRRRI